MQKLGFRWELRSDMLRPQPNSLNVNQRVLVLDASPNQHSLDHPNRCFGKGIEQHSKSLRLSVEEDAELALQALGFSFREIGWTRT